MARYATDFEGIPGGFAAPTGMDPNYRDGYHGMRMRADPRQAAYGAHRRTRRSDLGTAGGFDGIHDAPEFDWITPGPDGSPGGVRDPFTDDEFLRDFDARGQRYAPDPASSSTDRELPVRQARDWERPHGMDPHETGYSNRGMPPAGYGEGWARGPMRGAR